MGATPRGGGRRPTERGPVRTRPVGRSRPYEGAEYQGDDFSVGRRPPEREERRSFRPTPVREGREVQPDPEDLKDYRRPTPVRDRRPQVQPSPEEKDFGRPARRRRRPDRERRRAGRGRRVTARRVARQSRRQRRFRGARGRRR